MTKLTQISLNANRCGKIPVSPVHIGKDSKLYGKKCADQVLTETNSNDQLHKQIDILLNLNVKIKCPNYS